jgi:electron transfer flavoprotein alpha subunit
MGVIAVLGEHRDGKLRKAVFSAVTAGKILSEKTGKELVGVVCGKDVRKTAEEMAEYGLKKVYYLDHPLLKDYTAEGYSSAIFQLDKSAGIDYFLASATTTGKDLLPRVAVKLDAGMASDICEVVSGNTFKRYMYAGSIIATVKVNTPKIVLSIRGTAFPKAEKSERGEVVDFKVDVEPFKKRYVKMEEAKSERPELPEAEIVVSGGRGLKSAENFKEYIEKLADAIGAAVGASRAAVDAGFCPNDWQVGQTGKIVAPNLYIAIGISGAIQHLAGMKDSKVIVAINKDPEAPIFEVADYGLVADLFKVVPELREKLAKLKAEG